MPILPDMTAGLPTLAAHLAGWAGDRADRLEVSAAVSAMATAIVDIAGFLACGALVGPLGQATGKAGDIDPQRRLDVEAHERIVAALESAPVGLLVSEELDMPLLLAGSASRSRSGGSVTVAVDPVDGASNADTNAAIGTVFSVLPGIDTASGGPAASGLPRGATQLAAGFAVYGPQTVLVLTLGAGSHVFTLDPRRGEFLLTTPNIRIPDTAAEFAINASNHLHWDEPIRAYVEGCLKGDHGPRAARYNMRWTGSFVAEVYRILIRGGVYLYPADARPAYRNGRLRLAYEACPVAFIVEQAGGAASTGHGRILDVPLAGWHQRTPVVIGSAREVAHVESLHSEPYPLGERSPLFGRRGLFRT